MRKLLLCLICLFVLSGCEQTSRMTGEVSDWFGKESTPSLPQQAVLTPSPVQAVSPAPAPAPALPVAASPVKPPVTRLVKVAILLPLSGEQAAFGKSMQHGAELAVMELGRDAFELMPRDSGSTPGEAMQAARDAIMNGARLIIGPLFSSSVEAVKPMAAEARVPVLALSNDARVAGNGTYLIGFQPTEQVQRIVQFAARQNVKDIAVLASSSPYGDLVLAALEMPGTPVNVVTVVRYQNNAASIAAAVQELVMKRQSFQGLFIPEGGDALRRIVSQLASKNLTPRDVPFLGTGLWDDEIPDGALSGAWYAAPDSSSHRSFVARYQKSFGSKPVRLASLAYDATALAVALASRNVDDPFTEANLTNPNGFAGLDGIFRLTPQGLAEHGLAIKEVTRDGPNTLEAAPARF